MAARPFFPDSAIEWLIGTTPSRVLVVGASGTYATGIRDAGHAVLVMDRDEAIVSRLIARRPDLGGVVAQPESLPFSSHQFDVVVCPQNLHTFATSLALTEFARVLEPGGRLAITYLSRDDSVPWVQRLVKAVRETLPDAMTGDYGADSVNELAEAPFFPTIEQQVNRIWIPRGRSDLIDIALNAVGADSLSATERESLAAAVGAEYDKTARAPEPLQLPYQLTCWRSTVDHSELSRPIQPLDDALQISLGSPVS